MLKRLGDMLGYRIKATDGDLGTASDFYFDEVHCLIAQESSPFAVASFYEVRDTLHKRRE